MALFLAWLAAAGWLAIHHVVWRDEVRALNLALAGDTVWAMLHAIHGEGHPALWYLLLRGGHALTGARAVLPVTAFAIAAASAALFCWRAPFRLAVIALVLFSAYALVDYTVVARNYGIAMLLMLAIADRGARGRESGVTLGILLFLLCNTNAPSVLLAGGFVLFRAVELVGEDGWRSTPAARQFAIAVAFAAAGVLACAATIYPPYNDAVALAVGREPWLPFARLSAGLGESPVGSVLFLALLAGSVAGLARAPAALAAAVAVLLAASLFFQLIYPGMYRHQALVLVFLLCLYWLAAAGRGGHWPAAVAARWEPRLRVAQRWGAGVFAGLLALQTLSGLALANFTVQGKVFSRSRELGALLHRPDLRRAVVIGNPDVLLEPLSYYAPNPIWFVRERRWGRVVAFTRATMRDVSLGEMLDTARRLRAATGRPVVIVLADPLDPRAGVQHLDRGYLGTFTITPEQVRAFRAGTRLLVRYGPAQTDESYAVYLLR